MGELGLFFFFSVQPECKNGLIYGQLYTAGVLVQLQPLFLRLKPWEFGSDVIICLNPIIITFAGQLGVCVNVEKKSP